LREHEKSKLIRLVKKTAAMESKLQSKKLELNALGRFEDPTLRNLGRLLDASLQSRLDYIEQASNANDSIVLIECKICGPSIDSLCPHSLEAARQVLKYVMVIGHIWHMPNTSQPDKIECVQKWKI